MGKRREDRMMGDPGAALNPRNLPIFFFFVVVVGGVLSRYPVQRFHFVERGLTWELELQLPVLESDLSLEDQQRPWNRDKALQGSWDNPPPSPMSKEDPRIDKIPAP
ncbi:hypothetical protein M413DRAFT_13623 [Hebeloma cylindrosporum]|uniref:Uncharacterized protein n=1 Tax=Hebeloma cylindrosporum TaxID=76867 RepID=A0A0C3C0A6_HEBCY|nr:hypothetical protein M413DRAFT_13623 [Hebeloma cylindrosporum h7]